MDVDHPYYKVNVFNLAYSINFLKGVMRLSMGTLNFPYYTRCFNCACRFLVADNLNQSTLSTEKRLIDCMVFNSVFTGISVIS